MSHSNLRFQHASQMILDGPEPRNSKNGALDVQNPSAASPPESFLQSNAEESPSPNFVLGTLSTTWFDRNAPHGVTCSGRSKTQGNSGVQEPSLSKFMPIMPSKSNQSSDSSRTADTDQSSVLTHGESKVQEASFRKFMAVTPSTSNKFSDTIRTADGAQSFPGAVSETHGKSKAQEASFPKFMAITPSTSNKSSDTSHTADGARSLPGAVSKKHGKSKAQEASFSNCFPGAPSDSNTKSLGSMPGEYSAPHGARSQAPTSESTFMKSKEDKSSDRSQQGQKQSTASIEELPAPSVDTEETAGCSTESTFQKETTAIRIHELYHWCATVGVLLILQLVFDSVSHQFQHTPQPSEWCGLLLLLYSLASVVALHFTPNTRPYAAHLLAFGSLLVTCQIAWHWHNHVAEVKDSIVLQQRFWGGVSGISNSTAPASPVNAIQSSSSLYGLLFGASGLDVLDTATFFVVLFLNCLQSSFLCRLGIKITAAVSVLQCAVLVCWPLTSPHLHASWFCRIGATGLWTAHLIRSGYVWESELQKHCQYIDELHQTIAQSRKVLKDGQTADSVLNHMLKNTMADASGCIELVRERNTLEDEDGLLLSKGSDILFRGMWLCKMREAILSLVGGHYKVQPRDTNLLQFAEDFVKGREVALDCPSQIACLDPMVCNVILDNAVTNALRHGCPRDPQVKLTVQVSEELHDTSTCSAQAIVDTFSENPVMVRFRILNRANPRRPALVRWSTLQPNTPLPRSSSAPVLSDGLGLGHIRMVANAANMVAELWQEGEEVFFELTLRTKAPSSALTPLQSLQPATCPLPPGLVIMALEDSAITRRSLLLNLQKAIPDATIAMYGKDIDEVEEFKRAVLEKGDIIILDQNVDVPGNELLGTTILKELIAKGYNGFACIRSGNSAPADRDLSLRSGAHWHIGKEVPMREMICLLKAEYGAFILKQQEDEGPLHDPLPQREKTESRITLFADTPPTKFRPWFSGKASCSVAPNPLNVPHETIAGATSHGTHSGSSSKTKSASMRGAMSAYGVLSCEPPNDEW
eukprot:CAMPEP_0174301740 /NCGR_PEP_ID=MMETSP0809-20121228/59222_1 /TAXON_ID=73025 ORGANISM="Eutreptiella gymnastica-like, Strain CCMP1594" /NCGR_SAMPLE_ID=MMETSP0809 /ASSEMBLY_ACC=CAM_ASM_000658 /LENGTH=1039 /DNA_ID=CAMNT_0015407535 /DNA_START=31 /DNA_END=3147 /DNA_ORIENTATION=-